MNTAERDAFSSSPRFLSRALLTTTALVPLLTMGVSSGAVAQDCSVTGDFPVFLCNSTLVEFRATTGEASATVDSVTSAALSFYPVASETDPLYATLDIIGTTSIHRTDYPAIAWQSNRDDVNLSVSVGSEATLTSDDRFAGIWLRNDGSGDLSIETAGTVVANGVNQDGINLTTLNGDVLVDNSGRVTSAQGRGLYADGNSTAATASAIRIVNSGHVWSALAGARAINYLGLAAIENTGTVETSVRQGLVAWSQNGPASITNSGTVIAQDDHGIVSLAVTDDATIYNVGTVISRDNTSQADAGSGHHGLWARVWTVGDIAITNGLGATVDANQIGIRAQSTSGRVDIVQAGQVTAEDGIDATNADGAISVTNSGTVTATAGGMILNGTTNLLVNSGMVTTGSASEATILMGGGDSTIWNSGLISNTGGAAAIIFGNGTNRLVLDMETSVIDGVVQAGTGDDHLVLDVDTAASLSMLLIGASGQFRNFDFIEKSGDGVLTLTDSGNGFAGTTEVTGGTLRLDGDLGDATSTLIVGAAGSLAGNGTVGGDAAVSGTVTPGASIGTLAVGGDLAFSTGATYLAELGADSAADRIDVAGTAALAGTLQISGSPGLSPSAIYTVLTADGGLSGTFDAATSNLVFLDPQVTYGTTDVTVSFSRSDVSFSDVAVSPNQGAVAEGLDSLDLGNPVVDAVAVLDAEQAQVAYEILSGEAVATTQATLLTDTLYVREGVLTRLHGLFGSVQMADAPIQFAFAGDEPPDVPYANPLDQPVSMWAEVFGGWGHLDGTDDTASVDRTTAGILVGVDMLVAEESRIGGFLGYQYSDYSVDALISSSHSHGIEAGVYAGTAIDGIGLRGGAGLAWHALESSRTVSFAGFREELSGSTSALTGQAFAEVGYEVAQDDWALEPYAALTYTVAHTWGYSEGGGSSALTFDDSTTGVVDSTLGMRWSVALPDVFGSAETSGQVGWRHAFGDLEPQTTAAFAGGTPFTVSGTPIDRDVAVVGFNLAMPVAPSVTASLSYDGQYGSGSSDNVLAGRFTVQF